MNNAISAIRSSLNLLSRRDRKLLGISTLAQMLTAFMDLAGIALMGLVTALALSTFNHTDPPNFVTEIQGRLNLSGLSNSQLTLLLAAVAAGLLMSKSIINIFITRRVLRFLAVRQAIVSGSLTRGLFSLPLIQVQSRSTQETAYLLTSGVNQAVLVVLGQAVVLLSEFSLLILLGAGLFFISPIVTLFTIFFFSVIAFVLHRLLSGWAGRLGFKATEAEVGSYIAIQEALKSFRELVVSDRRDFYSNRIEGLRWQTSLVQSDLAFMALVPKYVFEVALLIGGGLLAVSQLMTRDLDAAVAIIAIFLMAGSRVVPSMLRLQGAILGLRAAAGQAQPTYRLSQQLLLTESRENSDFHANDKTSDANLPIDINHDDFTPSILLEGVSLNYPGSSHPALLDVSLKLAPGQSLAIVGPTGAGKSTLADVLLGVANPTEGSVGLSGLPPLDAVVKWPGAIAYVPQEVSMANATVRENVGLGLPSELINDDLVWDALSQAKLADFLGDTREGINTYIGENGITLSGGQRQRLGIARALYTRPKLLILDEATSALDAETENAISEMLKLMHGSVSIVTIAHRLATVRHCDIVAYLDSGRLIAHGTFQEVRNSVPEFDHQSKLLGL